MKTLCSLIIVLATLTTQAQSIANYTTALNTGVAYNSIASAGTPFGSWRNTATYSQDDNRSFSSDIGFDFWYNGVRYTQFSVSSNGFIDFSNSTADGNGNGAFGFDNNQFTVITGTNNAITPFYDDLTAQGGVGALGTSIKYLTTGIAPNRVLTIEWINMAVYLNITPSLNYQVKLYESTGKIEFAYGTMTAGTHTFSYSCGINSAPVGLGVAQLKMQQTANGTTFNNTAQNNLSTMPTANNLIGFTPPLPANPTGALTFTTVTNTSMNVNWTTNWATNEIGYVVYNSTDGVNYNFVAQTAVNAITYAATGLLPGTNYFWKVYAVTEGALSTSKDGTQATLAGGNKVSNVTTGNWNTAGSWLPTGVPTAGDNVTIANGHTITINVNNATCNNLTIGQGTSGVLQIGTNATALAMNFKNITVNAGAIFRVNTASNTTHTLTTQGNIVNNGTINFNSATNLCNVVFNKNGNQSITSTATTNNYNRITVNLGTSINNTLDIASTNFSAATGFLTLTNGTIKFSNTGTVTAIPFNTGAAVAMSNKTKLWLNSATTTLTSNDPINLSGNITVSAGTFNIGNAADENLQSLGGIVALSGTAIMNVAGSYYVNGINNLANFSIGGTAALNLPTIGSTSTTIPPFNITGVGSNFSMTGGTILILREGGNGAQDLGYVNTGSTGGVVNGGTLQIGNATTPLAQIISINTTYALGSLVVNSANVTANLINNAITVKNVNILAGTLLANNLDITVGDDWTNAGTYTPGTNTTTFNGIVTQTITKAGGETFNNLTFANSGLKTLGAPVTTNGNLTINAGATFDASVNNYATFVKGNWINNGTFTPRAALVEFNGTAASTIGGSTVTNFHNLTTNNTAGVSLLTDANLISTLKLTAGVFTTTGKVFTLVSNATGTARIDAITGGDIAGNITMQRYLAPGATNWRMLASCTGANSLADWSDDFAMSGFPGSQAPTFTFNSVYYYDETVAGDLWDFGYIPATDITNTIVNNRGYYCYVGPVPITMETVGAPVKFAQTIPVTFTNSGDINNDGWNFVGNPYPSSIDWTAAAWTKTNLNNELHVWNPNTSSYASYVAGVGVNGGTQYVPSSQAFWIKANAASPALSSTENCKATVDQAFMRSAAPQAITDVFKLSLVGNGTTDQIAIRFHNNGTDLFDNELDANKLYDPYSGSPRFSSVMHDSTDYSINSLAPLTSAITIPLRAMVTASGSYTIVRDSVINLTKNVCITLEDKLTNTITDLTQNYTYSFNILDTTKAPRFLLHFGNALAKERVNPTCYNGTNGQAIAIGAGSNAHTYTWYDANNAVIKTSTNVMGNDTLVTTAGVYTVIVNGNTGGCATLTDTIQINNPAPFTLNETVTDNSCNTSTDGAIVVNSVTQGTAPYTYLWNNGNATNALQSISTGNYTLQITDANNCVQNFNYAINPTNVVNANFNITNDSVFLYQANVTFNNYSTPNVNYTWSFGDGATSYDATPVHQYSTFGTYTTTLITEINGCTDTAQTVIVVIDSLFATEPIDTTKGGILTILNKTKAKDFIKLATVNGGYQLLFDYPTNTPVNVSVLESNGKTLSTNDYLVSNSIINVPFTNYAAGYYYISLQSVHGIKTFKIIHTK
jgi:hypothetical protein